MSTGTNMARVAALIGEPTRATMLETMLDGRPHRSGALSIAAGVSAATASGHLRQLLAGGLVAVATEGRQRYYQLASPEIARVLEGLADHLRLMIDLYPSQPDLHNLAGAVQAGLGQLDQAVAAYDRAIALRPDGAEVHANRASALEMNAPAAKKFLERQNNLGLLLKKVCEYVVDSAVAAGVLPTGCDRTVTIEWPEIVVRDLSKGATVLQGVAVAMTAGVEQGCRRCWRTFHRREHQQRPAVLVGGVGIKACRKGGLQRLRVLAFDERLRGAIGDRHYSARCCGLLPKSGPK